MGAIALATKMRRERRSQNIPISTEPAGWLWNAANAENVY